MSKPRDVKGNGCQRQEVPKPSDVKAKDMAKPMDVKAKRCRRHEMSKAMNVNAKR